MSDGKPGGLRASGIIIRYELMGVIIAIVIQTLAAVWWASGTSAQLMFFRQEINDLKGVVKERQQDNYSPSDAKRDFAVRDSQILELKERIINVTQEVVETRRGK